MNSSKDEVLFSNYCKFHFSFVYLGVGNLILLLLVEICRCNIGNYKLYDAFLRNFKEMEPNYMIKSVFVLSSVIALLVSLLVLLQMFACFQFFLIACLP